jgi:hypothetical protein
MRRSARSTPGIVIALVLLAGCAGAKTPSTAAPATASPPMATTKICQPIQSVSQSVTQLSNIGDTTTVGQVRAAQQKLTVALGTLGAMPAAHGNAYDSLKSMNEQLTAAVNAVKDKPDSATVGQVGPQLQAVKAKAAAAEPATTQLATAFSCKA